MTRTLIAACIAVVAAVPLPPAGLVGQTAAQEVAALEARLSAARIAAVHLLAPRAFDEADDLLREARSRLDRGDDPASIGQRVTRAESALAAAETAADRVRPRFDDALAARRRALEQEAPARSAEAWERAEDELEDAGRAAERGRFDDAEEPAARAAELYRRVGEAARSDRLLGDTEDARQAAMTAGGSELAPTTFAGGEAALAEARAGLADAPEAEVTAAADRALSAFRRAAWVSALADSVLSRSVPLERFIEAHERDLDRLAEAAGIAEPDLRDPAAPGAAEIEAAIRELLRRNAELASELRDEEARSRQLAEQVAALEETLSETERRYQETRGALMSRQALDDRLRETQALFTPEEGEIFQRGDTLVLRLHGLAFDSGSDEVDESMDPLLTKVERVLLDFPRASIRVEGHTDSQGNPDRNRALSQSRAIAIREYLLSRLPISSSRIEATGYGEDRPIARNDTEDGRARNRRIEIVLTLPR